MLLSFINLVLNPFCLVFFFFFATSKQSLYFENKGTNTQKLKVVPYLVYCLVFALAVLLITYLVGLLLPEGLNIWEIYQPKYYWLSIPGWLVTSLTLSAYFKGMEGNIMGFIFFPLLSISSLALLIANVSDIFMFSVNIEAPAIALNFWIRLLLHAFLPFYILVFINVPDKNGKKEKDWLGPIFGSLIFQLIFFGINWLIVKLWGNGLTFSQFFGQGQSIIYYLPMFGGMLYYISYLLSKYTTLSKNRVVERVSYFVMIFATLLMLLQLFNYIQLIREWF